MKTVFCPNCRKFVEYSLKTHNIHNSVHNISFICKEECAFCDECGNEIYVPEISDKNVENFNTAFLKAKENLK